jgi:subtilisin family serine protease
MPTANYADPSSDRKSVHVAAPGGGAIPGWVSEDSISMGAGTSQASAYVAGVAAAMLSNFSEQYQDGSEVKARLQITSRPLPLTSPAGPNQDDTKLNAGIVDPILALLDPSKHWLKKKGDKWAEIKLAAMPDKVVFKDFSDGDVDIQPASIRRIYRMTVGATSRWSIYTDYSIGNGDADANEVKRAGPLTPKVKTTKVFKVCDTPNSWLRADDIDDLIVAKSGLRADCH